MGRQKTSQVVIGMLIMALGLVFLGERMGFAPEWDMKRLWPLLLIVMGLAQILTATETPELATVEPTRGKRAKDKASDKVGSGLWFVFLGCVFLLHTFRVASIGKTWPLFIVFAGLSMVLSRDKSVRAKER